MIDEAPSGTPGRRLALALGLMVASGFAGLGYQIIWTQQAAIWLGHEWVAVLAVVAAFFGGLAVGALAFGPRIERSAHPARWYAGCEVIIGGWSVALAFLMAPVGGVLLALTGARPSPAWQWSVAFFGTFLLLLPATAAMGATLPAMERVMRRMRRHGSSIAALYAGNTFGAVVGVLAAAFWLMPAFGLIRTSILCAALNLLCAGVALALFAAPAAVASVADPRAGSTARSLTESIAHSRSTRPHGARTLALLAATGLLGIGYEVLVVRVLSQVAENTVYTFAMLLAVYLVGTALGAAAYQRWQPVGPRPREAGERLIWLLAVACLLGTLTLWGAETLKALVLTALGPGMAAALAAEGALAIAAFLLPTLMMGAVFSDLCTRARAAGSSFGRALGANTIGAAIAPVLVGVLLVPAVGAKTSLLLVAAGYLALTVSRTAPSARGVATA
ncbi:MAG: spermidine synthase, partial [Proteobacteria bacterium]|nr:spermidine synthase [Burkholderiales bacterium]